MKKGDIVRIAPDARWKQPMRGWAERQRLATVQQMHGKNATIRFNNARNPAAWNVEYFSIGDLILVSSAEEPR